MSANKAYLYKQEKKIVEAAATTAVVAGELASIKQQVNALAAAAGRASDKTASVAVLPSSVPRRTRKKKRTGILPLVSILVMFLILNVMGAPVDDLMKKTKKQITHLEKTIQEAFADSDDPELQQILVRVRRELTEKVSETAQKMHDLEKNIKFGIKQDLDAKHAEIRKDLGVFTKEIKAEALSVYNKSGGRSSNISKAMERFMKQAEELKKVNDDLLVLIKAGDSAAAEADSKAKRTAK